MGHEAGRTVTAPRYGRAFWIALPVGAALMAFGVIGLVQDTGVSAAADVARWLVGADLAHDFVLAPFACLVGFAVARALPDRCRAPVQAALLTTGVLLIVVFPALRGFGRDHVPDNPSVQPLDYTSSTLTALALVWAGAAAWLILRLLTSDRGGRRPPTRARPGGLPPSRC
jgi:hypothetical protein